jgi:glycosyltransferase involved in cell wall biosynthesis
MKGKGLLFVVNELRPGGAEMFIIRLAKFMQSEYTIYVHSCFPENDDADFVRQFNEEVPFSRFPNQQYTLPKWKEKVFWKINAVGVVLRQKGLFAKLRKLDKIRFYKQEVKKHNICITNSSASHSDDFAVNYLKRNFGIPAVISMHSAYNSENWGNNKEIQADFFCQMTPILCGADALLYTADHNIALLGHLPPLKNVLVEKVYLGYEPKKVTLSRQSLTIPENAFVVTMMARGIPEKGWEQAIGAFSLLLNNRADSLLILIHTNTQYMHELQVRHKHETRIRFVGYVADPSAILHNSDCTVLPSHYPESLPYAITESLAYGVPVFATPIAEIPQMLQTSEGTAGALIPLDENGVASVSDLASELIKAATDKWHLKAMKNRSTLAFAKFSMSQCGERYKQVFEQLIDGNK